MIIVNFHLNLTNKKYIGWCQIDNGYYFATSYSLSKMLECLKIKVTQQKGPGYAGQMRLSSNISPKEAIPYIYMTRNQRKFAFTNVNNQPKRENTMKPEKVSVYDTNITLTNDQIVKTQKIIKHIKNKKTKEPAQKVNEVSYKYVEKDGVLYVYKVEKVAEYKVCGFNIK